MNQHPNRPGIPIVRVKARAEKFSSPLKALVEAATQAIVVIVLELVDIGLQLAKGRREARNGLRQLIDLIKRPF